MKTKILKTIGVILMAGLALYALFILAGGTAPGTQILKKEFSSYRDSTDKEITALTHERDSAIAEAKAINSITDTDMKKSVEFFRTVIPMMGKLHEDLGNELQKLPSTTTTTTTIVSVGKNEKGVFVPSGPKEVYTTKVTNVSGTPCDTKNLKGEKANGR